VSVVIGVFLVDSLLGRVHGGRLVSAVSLNSDLLVPKVGELILVHVRVSHLMVVPSILFDFVVGFDLLSACSLFIVLLGIEHGFKFAFRRTGVLLTEGTNFFIVVRLLELRVKLSVNSLILSGLDNLFRSILLDFRVIRRSPASDQIIIPVTALLLVDLVLSSNFGLNSTNLTSIVSTFHSKLFTLLEVFLKGLLSLLIVGALVFVSRMRLGIVLV
jgi:hypothetical protein